jgi:hypothetical protein
MEPSFILKVISALSEGGTGALIIGLALVIVVLIWDRKQLLKTLSDTTNLVYTAKDKETQSIKEIVEKYHQGQLTVVQTLNEIKLVLVSIQASRK